MKTHSKIIGLIVVAVIGTGIFAGCQKGMFHHGPEKKAKWIVEEITEELDLSNAQVTKLEAISDHALSLRAEFKPKHEATHQNILSLLSEPTLDQDKLNELVNTKVAMFTAQAPEVITLLAGFYDSLDAEQQANLREHVEKRMKRHKKHH